MTSVYDRLVHLKDDKDAFDKERDLIFEEFISGFDESKHDRLRAMQWRVEHDLRHIKDPIARMNYMVTLLFSQVSKLHGAISSNSSIATQPTDFNNVIEFKREND